MSGNLTAVKEMTGILLKDREMSEKILVREKLPKTVYCELHTVEVFSRSLFCVRYQIYGFGSCTVTFLPHH